MWTKTDTNRITFKHLILHDIIHGVWHIEKGILFTLKEVLLHPEKTAIDYIFGKRIRYYNIFNLILIFVVLSIIIEAKIEALSKNKWYLLKLLINATTDLRLLLNLC